MRLLHEVQNLVAQGGATKIKCNKHLILKDRENHIFLDPLLCRARDGSCKVLKIIKVTISHGITKTIS
uniref:Uncharacterized protein n=1 Tax=Candidatus Kentrum sp. SD TaxID=2126332 RepID=A0A451BHP6_9GAMM|nr:MAG: hypothetical protein BECKSD772F_GA0070984_10022 [Candidatus Kentron sp. SD]VFK39086.1 MAG: hypothetical protein BECKSD772E_GA0070983_10022 [Candidatus Kentron sp. SD]VFK77789.1 MAG: hypothetical protein BECKSD772D_GA0070982_10023 [Candidatus Kentron sp. SD]